MKPFVIIVCAFVFVFTLYALAYLEHFYHGAWWAGATWVIGSIVFLASILGAMYACLEMK
jgi:hypothetical protein